MPGHQMKAGDLVELRPPTEVLATLDEAGATDGLPFMPEMLKFFGGTFRVQARVERACDTVGWGVRRIPDTVMLDDLRCSGRAHAGCQAGCRLYWKEVWLRPASGPTTAAEPDEGYATLEALVISTVETDASTTDKPIFRCQATDWFQASHPVGWWNVRSFVREWTGGNVSFWRFSATMTRIVLGEIGRRLRLIPREQFMAHDSSLDPVNSPPPRGLEPGSLVEVRSRQEIARTLDAKGRTRGLWFDREMLPSVARPTRSRGRSNGSSTKKRENSYS